MTTKDTLTVDAITSEITKLCLREGLGSPSFLGRSSSTTFTTPDAFLRVVADDQDSSGNLVVANMLSESLSCAPPLVDEPLSLYVGEIPLAVEVYKKLDIIKEAPPSWFEVGECLAVFHRVEVNEPLRSLRRVEACETRLGWADEETRERLASVMQGIRDVFEKWNGDVGLCHGDPCRSNLVRTTDELVWVDLEYAGVGPQISDVGFMVAECARFVDWNAAREFLDGYVSAGGKVDPVGMLLTLRLRDAYGVIDYCYQTSDAARREFQRRAASLGDLFFETKWGKSSI